MRRIAGMFLVSVIGLSAGCASDSDPADGADRPLRIGMMPKLTGIKYFLACQQGAEEAAEELGVELLYDGPTDNKVEDQVQMIDEWIALGYDAIAIAPNDPEVIAPALKRARDAGIVIVTWDADANPETSGRQAFCNQAPTDALAHTLVDIVGEATGGEGKAVIVSTTPTAPNQNAWISFMEPYLAEKYPGLELIETKYPAEDIGRARQMTADALTAHPDLKGIWGLSSVAVPGAAEAVRQAGKSGEVSVTGVTLPSELREYVRDGTVEEFALWSPADLGYLTVHIAKMIADGEYGDGVYDFGRLKGIEIQGDEVILGPPLVFNRDNIDDYDF